MAAVRLHGLEQLPENGSVPRSPEPHRPKLVSQVDSAVLPFLGGFGRFQKRLVALTWLPALLIAFGQFSDYFLLAQPDSSCAQPSDHAGNGSGVSASASPLPPGVFGNATRAESSSSARCKCTEPRLELQLGLQENVVTKVGHGTLWSGVLTGCGMWSLGTCNSSNHKQVFFTGKGTCRPPLPAL